MLSKFCFIRVAKSTKIIGGQRLCSQPNIAHAQSPEPVSKGPRFLKWMGKGVTLLIGGIYVYFVVGSYVATISYTKERRYLTDEEVETYRTIARNMREKFPEFSDGELRSTCEEHFFKATRPLVREREESASSEVRQRIDEECTAEARRVALLAATLQVVDCWYALKMMSYYLMCRPEEMVKDPEAGLVWQRGQVENKPAEDPSTRS